MMLAKRERENERRLQLKKLFNAYLFIIITSEVLLFNFGQCITRYWCVFCWFLLVVWMEINGLRLRIKLVKMLSTILNRVKNSLSFKSNDYYNFIINTLSKQRFQWILKYFFMVMMSNAIFNISQPAAFFISL